MRFYVKKQKLRVFRPQPVVSDTMNYLEAELQIDSSEWDGLEKWLHFRQGETVYDFKLDGENKIQPSAGLNLPAGQWEVYLHGERKSGSTVLQRITTDCCMVEVQQFGQMDGVSGPIPTEQMETNMEKESRRVAELVMGRQTEQTFSLAFLCDMHCGTEYEDASGKYAVNDEAVKDAGEALALLMKRCPLDAVVLGGDLSTGSWKSTREKTKQELSDCGAYLFSGNTQPVLYLQGNHDDAPYMATKERLSATELYAWFNRKNMLMGVVLHEGNVDGNYGYMDFSGQKIRLIYLNTDEKANWESVQIGSGAENNYLNAGNMSTEQLDFLANGALDFSAKEDAAKWGIIVCSHRPLNEAAGSYLNYESNITNALSILEAYLSGGNGIISHNGSEMSYNFSGLTEKAKLLCCVHGHNHRYCHEWLGSGSLLSVGCPNVMNGRERESDNGIVYSKVPDTAKSTAFCVITVDKESGKVYADHYGAGYDRQWLAGAGDEPSEERENLIPLSIDVDGNIYNGAGYALNTRLDSGGNAVYQEGLVSTGFMPCKLADVVCLENIRMAANQSDSSSLRISFYNASMEHLGQTNATGANGVLDALYGEDGNISEFTVKSFDGNDLTNVAYFRLCSTELDGNSVVRIKVQHDESNENETTNENYKNHIPLSVDVDGAIYNSIGYRVNTRLNSGGVATDYDGYTCIGFIPCKLDDVVYVNNIRLVQGESDSGNLRISFYNSAKEHIAQTNATGANGNLGAVYGSDGNMTQFTVKAFAGSDFSDVAFFRLCSTELDGSSIITVNETIT